MKTMVKKCFYNESFVLQYNFFEDMWTLEYHDRNGNLDDLVLHKEDLVALADLGKAIGEFYEDT